MAAFMVAFLLARQQVSSQSSEIERLIFYAVQHKATESISLQES